MIRLLICDDSVEARAALRTVLSGTAEIEIVGEAADGSEAIALAVQLSPDVVLMDVSMPGMDGVAATRRIRELEPGVRVVAFAGSDDGEVVKEMLEAGAGAYCVKGAPVWELERAIAGANEPLVRLAHSLSRSLPGGIGSLVARELAELSCAAFAAVYLSSPEVSLSVAGIAGADADRLSSAPGVVRRAFERMEPAQATAHELAELYRLAHAACGEAFAVPLLADGQPLGALLVAMPANVQLELDRELVIAVADLAAASLASERRVALTFAEARRDALTGLPNRRAFDEHLDSILGDPASDGRDVCLTLVDLDDFKRVNDEEGHPAGDATLREMSRVLLRCLRADEEAFRIGGDEFALVLDGADAAGSWLVGRVHTALARRRRGRTLPSVSAGVASARVGEATKEELLRRADAALYAAKRAGKNRVVVYGVGVEATAQIEPRVSSPPPEAAGTNGLPVTGSNQRGLRVLLVDDDPGLRTLLRTTFEIIDIEVEEAKDAADAAERIEARAPDVIVLDVAMPGLDGISFCRGLKAEPATSAIPVVLLTGLAETGEEAGADAVLRKPFSPLELLSTIENISGRLYEGPFRLMTEERPEEQLLLYAQDLRRLVEIERAQRGLLQSAYLETVTAFASALESKDMETSAHSRRVHRYACELTRTLAPELLDDPSLEYGFLLHDVGKIAVPDRILQKAGPLTKSERELMQAHTVIGEQMLANVALLQGEGLKVIRSHHERWDGRGYPDRLRKTETALGGRIFAVADALDAMTTERPYHAPRSWDDALAEIVREARGHFDPAVVDALRDCEPALRRMCGVVSCSPPGQRHRIKPGPRRRARRM